jgi:hypothetical protein
MQEIGPNQIYTHYKGGRYRIITVAEEATNAREGELLVVYASVEDGRVWCRDFEEFTESVTLPNGETQPRFVLTE